MLIAQSLLTHEKLNRPLRLRRGVRQEEIFAFRWKDAEDKRLAPDCDYRFLLKREPMFLESSFFPAFQNLILETLEP